MRRHVMDESARLDGGAWIYEPQRASKTIDECKPHIVCGGGSCYEYGKIKIKSAVYY